MRSLLAALLACCTLSAHAGNREWNFRVWLDEREIGQHRFTLRASGNAHELRSTAQFDVRVLFLNAYRYRHEALERWEDGCLRSLASKTDTNGELQRVDAVTRAGRLVVEHPQGRAEHAGCIMSFAYWDPQILGARQLLNSQTGELLPVTVLARGEESIRVRGQALLARRHRINAPQLQIDLWYADGVWVALEAPAAGGRRLRYELM